MVNLILVIEDLIRRRDQLDTAINALRALDIPVQSADPPYVITQPLPAEVESEPAARTTPERQARNLFWTKERLDELWTMRENGVKPTDIADHFDKPAHTIYNVISRLKKERGTAKPSTVAKTSNVIGAEPMKRAEVVTLLIQHGWKIERTDDGEPTLYGDVLTDQHLINLAQQYKKLPIMIVEG